MASCPSCRATVDPEFYSHCPDCGAPLQGEVPPVEGSAPMAGGTLPPPPPPPPPLAAKSGCSTTLVLIVVGVVGLGLVGGLIGLFTSAKRDDSGRISRSGTISVNELEVGDCADYPSEAGANDEVYAFSELTARPCSETHDLEVFATPLHPADSFAAYPGDDAIIEWAADACLAAFEPYTGVSYDLSPDLDVDLFWPSEGSWSGGNRGVQCLLIGYDPADFNNTPKLTGSKRAGA